MLLDGLFLAPLSLSFLSVLLDLCSEALVRTHLLCRGIRCATLVRWRRLSCLGQSMCFSFCSLFCNWHIFLEENHILPLPDLRMQNTRAKVFLSSFLLRFFHILLFPLWKHRL